MPHRQFHAVRASDDTVSSHASVHGSEYNNDAVDGRSWAMGPSHTEQKLWRVRKHGSVVLYSIPELDSDEVVVDVIPDNSSVSSRLKVLDTRYQSIKQRVGRAVVFVERWQESDEEGSQLYNTSELIKEHLRLLMGQVRQLSDDCLVLQYAVKEQSPPKKLDKLQAYLEAEAERVHDLQDDVAAQAKRALKDVKKKQHRSRRRR